MLKAIIFDMDGVLVDTEPIHFETDVNVLEKYGATLSFDYYKQFIGTTTRNIWENLKIEYKLPATVDELIAEAGIEKKKIIEKGGYRPIKGVKELIQSCKDAGYLLAVASSSPYDYILEVVHATEVYEYFLEILSGEHFQNPKPAPDIFLETAKRLKVNPEECLVIEDSGNGVRAAKAAGMVCLGFVNPESGDQDLRLADYLIYEFEEKNSAFLEKVFLDAVK